MADKYQNKYRIESARLQSWDYGWNGAYFLTICTKNREHYFGEITDGNMQLSEIGVMANQFLTEIPERYPYAKLDAFVVMPNHVHVIVIIDKTMDELNTGGGGRGAINRVSTTTTDIETQKPGGITGNKNPMLHKNISRIINWYKGRVTFESRKINPDFEWQSRFHDHIVRNDKSLHNIQHYINNNPLNWKEDTFYA